MSIDWKPFDARKYADMVDSGSTYKLPREYWPPWAREPPQFQNIAVGWATEGQSLQSNLTTSRVLARFIIELIDPKDAPNIYNHNVHWVAQDQQGNYYISGPMRVDDIKHHSPEPLEYLRPLGPPRSSSSSST